MKISIILLVLLSILGWSGNSDQLEYNDRRDLPSDSVTTQISTSLENDSFLSVNMNTPETLSMAEELIARATLTNITDTEYHLEYGNKIVNFFLYDETGKQINSLKTPAILNEKYIKSKETIVEQFNYHFDGPGIYYIEAVAEFKIKDGNEYTLNLGKNKLTVK